jgi:hypothetical protein
MYRQVVLALLGLQLFATLLLLLILLSNVEAAQPVIAAARYCCWPTGVGRSGRATPTSWLLRCWWGSA